MAIQENLLNLFRDIGQDGYYTISSLIDSHDQSLKKYFIEPIALLQRSFEKAVIHYPRTILLALIVSTICSVVFFSIGSLFIIAVNSYLFYKNEGLIFRSIRTYDAFDCSEWSAIPDYKQSIILLIKGENLVRNSFQCLGDFFRQIGSSLYALVN